jgi:hypothetical protein
MEFLKNYRWSIVGVLLGSMAGYAYYYFVGCANGHCIISSKPVNSTLYGAVMGWLFAGSFQKENKINA